MRAFVAPNVMHHLGLDDALPAFPGLPAFARPSLQRKRADLKFAGLLGDQPDPLWAEAVDQLVVGGMPRLDEMVFFHKPSRTLVLRDLAFNVLRKERCGAGARLRLPPAQPGVIAAAPRGDYARRSRPARGSALSERLHIDRLATPLGPTLLVSDPGGVLLLAHWEESARDWQGELRRSFGDAELVPASEPSPAAIALGAYFQGDLGAVARSEVSFWGSEFQTAVWRALRTIPAGGTWSYGQLAKAIGRPTASRAVGLANGANPIPIVVPCHRVIGGDGSLTGFGGGLWRKRWLLDHEARYAGTASRQLEMGL